MTRRPSEPPAEQDGEMLDRVDDDNRVIGTVRRSECHGDPALQHRAVHVFVVNSAGHTLLQKRSLRKLIQPGKWDTSVGGHIPAGEPYEQGALREMAEELGIRQEDAAGLRFQHAYVWRSPVETEHVRTYLFRHDGPFQADPAEIDEIRFWSREELRQAAGQEILTPNLEHELRLRRIL